MMRLDLETKADPRKAFDDALATLAGKDARVYALTADMGTALTTTRKSIGHRYVDFGIAEQNMVGAAAGLASCGKVPFVATIAAFISMRACEQVRTDVAYPKANVKLVGFGCGTSYGVMASTHHATEDLGIIRSMPNMTILSPAGAVETARAIEFAGQIDGPVYIRVGRGEEPVVYPSDYAFDPQCATVLRTGSDLAILATGSMVWRSLRAANELQSMHGLRCTVLDIHTIKPLDRSGILRAIERVKGVVTVEDHNTIGGLGSAISEIMAEEKLGPLRRLGIPDTFCIVGSHEEILSAHGAGVQDIVKAACGVVSMC